MTMLSKNLMLRTDRLVLRPFEESDLENALSIFYNEEVRQTYMLPDFPTREKAIELFRRIQAISLNPDRIDYAIDLRGQLIGFINDCGIEGDTVELGYVIHPDHKGQGFATEALAAVIAELFRMGFACVLAAHFEENPASGRVMQKCGMHRIEKEETIEYRGCAHRCLYYEIKNNAN
ncbi:MAG: GNAT family N-acetyltransferase [Clostridia bacterium]|nr:GNAT family N-acetyltransferase [Clostridia bacterium]